MKIKLLAVAAGIGLSALTMSAKAQKTYTEGVITYNVVGGRSAGENKTYFKGDSSLTVAPAGPGKSSILIAGKGDLFAVLLDIPVASIRVAAVATPAEIEEFQSKVPEFTFTTTTETKTISNYNCKKVNVKDANGVAFDVWVTNDVTIPTNSLSTIYAKLGGFPVQFKANQLGQYVDVTVKSVSDEKVPAKTFAIPDDLKKITMTDLGAMLGGGRK